MPQSLVAIATDLTLALVKTGTIRPEDMQETLQKTYATLSALKAQEAMGTTTTGPVARTALGDWRKSITRHAVICLECGQSFKQLSGRHLRTHGLDNQVYRTKYGIPRTQPLAARATTERRRQVARETRPWENAPNYRKGQAQEDVSAAAEPDAEAVQDETGLPSAKTPAQPKRQRKTTPKKTARRTRSAG